ncbi:MAG TPA: sigma-70 family RNA polymerase sigma factor [Vicinamibacterales bacterium]|nr:sigma-70 family RNA polymerase sigma factor [Vicinamibacterales bacterium]
MHSRRTTRPSAGVGNNSEPDLIQRCLEGDATAWDTLVRVYWKRVFNVAYKFVARFDEAEDLTQEIFVKVFRALPTFDRRASFETWLTKVSRNLCVDRYRRRRREEERFTDEVDPDTIQIDELVSRPDATLEQRDEIAMVRRALAKLDPTYREAVALRDVHDLSYEEIARRLQLPEGTVKSRISRGRKELARHLRLLQEHARASAASKRSGERQEASYAKN